MTVSSHILQLSNDEAETFQILLLISHDFEFNANMLLD